jgi:hypothetical protein
MKNIDQEGRGMEYKAAALAEFTVARFDAGTAVHAGNVAFVFPWVYVHKAGPVAALQSVHCRILVVSMLSLGETGPIHPMHFPLAVFTFLCYK